MTAVIDQFPRRVREIENQWITLPDGCRLAARIWLPDDAEADPVPAILEYLPYRKRDGTIVRDHLTHPYFAGHGYACVRVDMRGSGDADGVLEDEYSAQELADGVEVINWIAAQAWCTGKVGMMGISWGGFNGLQIAALDPEPLKAVITLCSTDDRYADDIHYKGGCLLNENLGWGATMLAYSSRAPDPLLYGDRWYDAWMERLQNEPFLAARWLHHQRRDSYWKHGSVCEDYSRIKAAVLAVGGWNDAYSNAIPRMLNGLKSPVKAIIGPWTHKYPHFAVPEPRIGFLQEALRWWDFWLKGEPTGVLRDPAVRAFIMDSYSPQGLPEKLPGRWIAEGAWPGPLIEPNRLYLTPAGLSPDPGDETKLEFCSPQTTGRDGGEFCVIWLGPEFAGDQARDDAGSLTFETAPLGTGLDIVGAPELELEFIADRPVTHVAVRLNDVRPDGQVTRITYALQNLAHIASHEHPEALEPGERYFARIKLDDVAWHLPRGHRLRLSISTSYWPMMWPAPEPVTLAVQTARSWLTVPARSVMRGEKEPTFPQPVSAPPVELEELRPEFHKREQSEDPDTGAVTLEIVDDFGMYREMSHGLVSGGIGRETHFIQPDDPLSAKMSTHWTEEMIRDEVHVRTETYSSMTSSKTHFHLTARIEAWLNDELVFERDFSEDIERDLI
jgi:putative CocE/NonD family hydrolase